MHKVFLWSWMSAPSSQGLLRKTTLFSCAPSETFVKVFGPGRPPGYPPRRPRDIPPKNFSLWADFPDPPILAFFVFLVFFLFCNFPCLFVHFSSLFQESKPCPSIPCFFSVLPRKNLKFTKDYISLPNPQILGKDREHTKITKEIPCLKLTKEIQRVQRIGKSLLSGVPGFFCQKKQGLEGHGFLPENAKRRGVQNGISPQGVQIVLRIPL